MTSDDLAARIDGFSHRFDNVDGQFATLRQSIDELTSMDVRFEETHRLLRLGLEGQEILEGSIARRFDSAEKKRDDELVVLTAVARRLRVRVEAVEPRST